MISGSKTPFKRIAGVVLPLVFIALTASAGPRLPATPGEAAGYKAYTQNEDIALFLSLADAVSPELAVRIVGRTGTSRPMRAATSSSAF